MVTSGKAGVIVVTLLSKVRRRITKLRSAYASWIRILIPEDSLSSREASCQLHGLFLAQVESLMC